MQDDITLSPYLRRPLRSLEEVLLQRSRRAFRPHGEETPRGADNNNAPPPARGDVKSA